MLKGLPAPVDPSTESSGGAAKVIDTYTYLVCPRCGELNKASSKRCRQQLTHRLDDAPQVRLTEDLTTRQKMAYAMRNAAGREALLRQWGADGDLSALVANAPKRANPLGRPNEQMVCPHCQAKGNVHTKFVQ